VSPSTTVTYAENGDGIDGSYKAAIAVVGETPYTEGAGDRPGGLGMDSADLAVLAKLRASGVPVVVVLVSGRPLDVANELSGWDALVAAWLPGTEGQGVADVLFGVARPTGRLPLTWAQHSSQQPINDGDGQPALFPYGYGQEFPASQNPRNIIGAAYFDGQSGTQLERCSDSGCGQNVGWIAPGDYLWYDDVDFGGSSPTTVLARVASAASSGTIEFRLDSTSGPVVARVPVSGTGGWQSWTSTTVPLTAQATGKHRLYVVFTGPGGDFVNVNWFQFS
jgi:beta-glucosidase